MRLRRRLGFFCFFVFSFLFALCGYVDEDARVFSAISSMLIFAHSELWFCALVVVYYGLHSSMHLNLQCDRKKMSRPE
jgi:hypothetical protein